MQLYYRQFGEGKPLIILHGLFGMSDNWVTLGKKFAEYYKVYIIDHRNHGRSPHSPLLNYYTLVDDLSDFIEENQIENPILLGHSMGGKTAMLYTLDNPNKVDKLIVADIGPGASKLQHMEMIYAMLHLNFDEAHSRKDVELQLSKTINSEKIRMIIMKNLYWVDKERLGWRLNIQSIHNNIDAIIERIESNSSFNKPVLFIKGGLSDYLLEERDKPLINKLFTNSKIEVIEGATHWLHAEAPNEFYNITMNFLEA